MKIVALGPGFYKQSQSILRKWHNLQISRWWSEASKLLVYVEGWWLMQISKMTNCRSNSVTSTVLSMEFCQRLAPWSWETQNGSYQSPPAWRFVKLTPVGRGHSGEVVSGALTNGGSPFQALWEKWAFGHEAICSGRHAHPSCVMWWGDQGFSHLEATWCGWESTDFGSDWGMNTGSSIYWLSHPGRATTQLWASVSSEKKGGAVTTTSLDHCKDA